VLTGNNRQLTKGENLPRIALWLVLYIACLPCVAFTAVLHLGGAQIISVTHWLDVGL